MVLSDIFPEFNVRIESIMLLIYNMSFRQIIEISYFNMIILNCSPLTILF